MRGLGSLTRQVEPAATAGYQFVEPLEHHLSETECLDSILREYAISAPTAHTALRTVKAQQSRMVDNRIRCGTREDTKRTTQLQTRHTCPCRRAI